MLPRRLALAAAAAFACWIASAQAQNPITIGFGMALDRRARPERQGRAAGHADLGGQHQCQGRPARPAGEAGLLRRPVQSVNDSGPLYQAARRRQGGPGHQRLRHQHDRAGDADHHAAQPHLPEPVRPRGEHRVQVPEILLLHADRRTGAEAELCRGLLRHRDGAEPEAADAGDGRRGCGVPAQRDGRRARAGEAGRTEDRLRQDLSADDDGLHADRPRDPGDQSGSRAGLLLSARHGGHDPCRARGRAEGQAVRRRHGRAAEHRDQGAAWSAAERHRRLRFLAAMVGAGQSTRPRIS